MPLWDWQPDDGAAEKGAENTAVGSPWNDAVPWQCYRRTRYLSYGGDGGETGPKRETTPRRVLLIDPGKNKNKKYLKICKGLNDSEESGPTSMCIVDIPKKADVTLL